MPTLLDYQSEPDDVVPRGYLIIALLCWFGPASVGVGALLGYWWTRDDGFAILGLFDLFVGIGAFVIGVCVVIAYLRRAMNGTNSRRRAMLHGFIVLALLAANLPLAWLCNRYGNRLIEGEWAKHPSD